MVLANSTGTAAYLHGSPPPSLLQAINDVSAEFETLGPAPDCIRQAEQCAVIATILQPHKLPTVHPGSTHRIDLKTSSTYLSLLTGAHAVIQRVTPGHKTPLAPTFPPCAPGHAAAFTHTGLPPYQPIALTHTL